MPAPAQPAAAAAPPAEPEGWEKKLIGIARPLLIFMAVQYATNYGMKYFGIGPQAGNAPAPATTPLAPAGDGAQAPISADSATGGATAPRPPAIAKPVWPLGTPMSMFVYVSTAEDVHHINPEQPTVSWDNLTYGNWDDAREEHLLLDVPQSVRTENGSWYADVFLVKDGGSPVGRPRSDVAHHRKGREVFEAWLTTELTRWMPKRRIRKEKSLLSNDEEPEEEGPEEEPEDPKAKVITSFWSRNLTLTVLSDHKNLDTAQIQPQLAPYYHLAPSAEDGSLRFYPPIFPNDFWLLKENMMPINDTTQKLPLHITYNPISNWKFQTMATLTVSFEQAAQQQGSNAEFDEIKRMLTETNPILLITTAIVSVLHMVFEFLAFSSDVKHWKSKDKENNLVGVSLRTILTNCFVQLIILLYLHDSSEETSWMILFSQGIGLLIEAWKITKVVNIRLVAEPTSLFGYRISVEDKHELSEDEKKTQEYDRLAFRIVSYFAIPILLAYAGYSLKYSKHRSWYSFIISTLAQAIYMFGFCQMIPQLIINYKLKSVAHMPMKAMVYKTLSTVVDDFFAFCIKMPWLHRLACFRDDVVFVILLYQRWIYRVDYSRVNEYGQVADEDDKAKAEEKAEEKAKEGDKLESKKDK